MASEFQVVRSFFFQLVLGPIQGSGYLKGLINGNSLQGHWTQKTAKELINHHNPGASEKLIEADFEYITTDLFALFSLLLGIPTRNFKWDGEHISSFRNFLINLFRWHHPSAPPWQKGINFFSLILPILAFSWHLLKALPSLAIHLVEIVGLTALAILFAIPAGFAGLCALSFGTIADSNLMRGAAIFILIPVMVVLFIAMLAGVVTAVPPILAAFVFRAIFSPYQNFMNALRCEGFYAFFSTNGGSEFKKIMSVLSIITALLSLAISIVAYALLAIYALPFIALGITSIAPAYLPTFMVTGLQMALTAFSQIASLAAPWFAPIGSFIAGFLPFISSSLTASAISLAAIIGAALPLIGCYINYKIEEWGEWYYKLGVNRYFELRKNGEHLEEESSEHAGKAIPRRNDHIPVRPVRQVQVEIEVQNKPKPPELTPVYITAQGMFGNYLNKQKSDEAPLLDSKGFNAYRNDEVAQINQ